MMTAPVYDQLALWYGRIILPNQSEIELFIGFWGVCTYHSNVSNIITIHHRNITKSICTNIQPAYSFHFDQFMVGSKEVLKSDQTIFLLWYPFGEFFFFFQSPSCFLFVIGCILYLTDAMSQSPFFRSVL